VEALLWELQSNKLAHNAQSTAALQDPKRDQLKCRPRNLSSCQGFISPDRRIHIGPLPVCQNNLRSPSMGECGASHIKVSSCERVHSATFPWRTQATQSHIYIYRYITINIYINIYTHLYTLTLLNTTLHPYTLTPLHHYTLPLGQGVTGARVCVCHFGFLGKPY
jgi:hypothetical protein